MNLLCDVMYPLQLGCAKYLISVFVMLYLHHHCTTSQMSIHAYFYLVWITCTSISNTIKNCNDVMECKLYRVMM
jgi:hypothetical protein